MAHVVTMRLSIDNGSPSVVKFRSRARSQYRARLGAMDHVHKRMRGRYNKEYTIWIDGVETVR